MVAGAMMERLTNTSWETLLENNLFTNLGMASSGFGVPDAQDNLSQPIGHLSQGSGLKASNTDNPAVWDLQALCIVVLKIWGSLLLHT
jgi:CubicO group peptidase (beta-lactamase class C family)